MARGDTHNSIGGATVTGSVIQVGAVAGDVTIQNGAPPSAPGPGVADGWEDLATGSSVWSHVSGTRDTTLFRQEVSEVAGVLQDLCARAEDKLGSDPWNEPGHADRFLKRIEWLLGESNQQASSPPLELYPVEAALMVLTPFLYRTHYLCLSVKLAAIVVPAKLRRVANAGSARMSFETFAADYDLLLQRAKVRPESEASIGWWMFHRWLSQRDEYAEPGSVDDLLNLSLKSTGLLKEALDRPRVTKLLHGLRRGPGVCNPEYLDTLRPEDEIGGPGHQRVREQRLVLVVSLAYGTTLDAAALPSIIAEHLGIPHSVDMAQLRQTLECAVWGGLPELPVLRAECYHEAVVEGLRTHTARVDELLHAVHRVVRERITHPMPMLPARLSAEGVVPAEGVFDGWARFSHDGRRVRELLMGVQLYKDRGLAIRELYQNALDACRYRRARTEYLDRTTENASFTYEGKISFEQGIDGDGRPYLECLDNGVGMSDAELRGVFSNAGERFAEQPDFKLERADWNRLEPPVELFPNSRFGIGVMSYFMLADEVRVRTCRMGRNGVPGPLLEASIHGPGHLFRIVTCDEHGREFGTRVRLYLRVQDREIKSLSCVDALERLLGISEFTTTVRHGQRNIEWEPRRLRPRERPHDERFGLNAHGKQVEWPEAPDGVQVIWSNKGGALLVDGLLTEPAENWGRQWSADQGVTGVVINLSQRFAPEQLSVDRSEVLDDQSAVFRNHLVKATDSLFSADKGLLDFEWLCEVADSSAELADIIVSAAIKMGRSLPYRGGQLDIDQTGWIPEDSKIVAPVRNSYFGCDDYYFPYHDPKHWLPDHIFLWRTLVHRPKRFMKELLQHFSEKENHEPVRLAFPSDERIARCSISTDRGNAELNLISLLDSPGVLGSSLGIAARRAVDLGFDVPVPDILLQGEIHFESGIELLRLNPYEFKDPRKSATVTELMLAASCAHTTVSEVAASWRDLGLDVPGRVCDLACAAETDDLLLKSPGKLADAWLNPGEVVPLGHIAEASLQLSLSVQEVCDRLKEYGLVADSAGLPDRPSEDTITLLKDGIFGHEWIRQSTPVSAAHVLYVSSSLDRNPADIALELEGLGIELSAPLPCDANIDDIELFFGENGRIGSHYKPSDPFPYEILIESFSFYDSFKFVMGRLGDYGITLPIHPPARINSLDRELIRCDGPLSWWDLTTCDDIPLARIVVASRSLGSNIKALVERLERWGISTSARNLPKGLSFREALILLRYTRGNDGGYLVHNDWASLQRLLELSKDMNASVSQVVSWLTCLGIPMPDVSKTIRTALARVPLAMS